MKKSLHENNFFLAISGDLVQINKNFFNKNDFQLIH